MKTDAERLAPLQFARAAENHRARAHGLAGCKRFNERNEQGRHRLRQRQLDQDPEPRGAEIAPGLQRRPVERGQRAGQQQRDERVLLPHGGDDDPAPVEIAHRLPLAQA
jgi:hypothetical protein